MTAALPKLTTPSRLAARWECSDTLVYDMLNSGDLPGFKLGGKLWRIRMTDVEAYEARTAAVTAGAATGVADGPVWEVGPTRAATRLARLARLGA